MRKTNYLSLGLLALVFACTPKPIITPPQAPPPGRPAPPPPEAPKPAPVVSAAPNTLTEREKAQGWQLLFDGFSSDGWHAYGSRAIGPAWKAVNGTLYLDAESKKLFKAETGGDIVTDTEYGNFELQLDWKISKGGNSGIIIYSNEDKNKYPTMWATGPEMQILDNNGHADGKIKKHRAGDLYDLISSRTEPVRAVGEWNHSEIRAVNGRLDFYLNGEHVISTTMWDDNWRSLIANSKFASMPDFGTFRKGRIGLQDHGNDVWFRNIKIRRL